MRTSVQQKIDLFFLQLKPLSYKKGGTILRAGEEPRVIFYLKKGFIRLYSTSGSGEELTLIIFRPGDVFPLMWAIAKTPNTYFLEAMTDAVLLRANREKFMDFMLRNPDALFFLTSEILGRLGRLLKRMEYLAFGDASNKIASILVICAERFGRKVEKSVVIEVPLTHYDIATLVGMTRETASIEMKRLEKKGLISYWRRRIAVKNLRGLKRESTREI